MRRTRLILWPASSRRSPIFGGDADEVRSGEVRFELLARAPVLVEGEEVGVLHAVGDGGKLDLDLTRIS
jgi:hypothetical protein